MEPDLGKINQALDSLVDGVMETYYFQTSSKREAIEYLHSCLPKYNKNKGRAFSYLTSSCVNYFRNEERNMKFGSNDYLIAKTLSKWIRNGTISKTNKQDSE